MAINATSLSKPILTPSASPDAEYKNGSEAWESVSEYLSYKASKLATVQKDKTILVKQEDGTVAEMWNANQDSVNTFVLKQVVVESEEEEVIPVNNNKVTIKHDGDYKGEFTLNQSSDITIDVGSGTETVFTAEFLKKVLVCRMWNKVHLTSLYETSPNMTKYNGLPDPGTSSVSWCGAGTSCTAGESTRLIIHNVNVDAWKGRKFKFTVAEGYEFAIASGTVTQNASWTRPYPQTSDIPWNWHGHTDPVTITLGDMISIMIRTTTNSTINWNYFYSAMWDLFTVEETADSVSNPPRKLKDDRYVGYRVGILGDSVLAGASTLAYKSALDVLVSDYGIVPVPRCIAGSCIAPSSTAYSRDDSRFNLRVDSNWQFTVGGYYGQENGTNREKDPFLGVLIFCVNDVLMDKVALDENPIIEVTNSNGTIEKVINTEGLNPDGYIAALIDLESKIKAGFGSILSHIYMVGPYNCRWPGNYPMTTTGKNPNGNTGEDYVRVQRQFCMLKGWSYLDILSSQLNTFLPGVSNDQLHPSQQGHQMLGDHLGQFLCGTILTQASPIFNGSNSSSSAETTTEFKTINGETITGTGNIVTPTTEVIDNLTSTSTTGALSAYQGKVLKDELDGKMSNTEKFVTINGQPVKGSNIDIVIASENGVVTKTKMVVDLQPTAGSYGYYNDLEIPVGRTVYIGFVDTAPNSGVIKNTKGGIWIKYEDGTTDLVKQWTTEENWFYEFSFTPTKKVVAIGSHVSSALKADAPRIYCYHYEQTPYEVSPWNGKRWLIVGDSIYVDNKHMYTGLAEESSPYMIGDELGMLVFNASWPGWVTRAFLKVPSSLKGTGNFDVISIALGTNNHVYNTAVGELHDSFYTAGKEDPLSYDNDSSFMAEYQLLYEEFRKYYPTVPILMHSTLKRFDTSSSAHNDAHGDCLNGANRTLKPYNEAIKEIAENYGCPFINLYNCCSPKTAPEREAWFTPNDDGVHLNENAHRYRMLPIIKEAFRTILPYEGVYVSTPELDALNNWTVTLNLENAESSNSDTMVAKDDAYSTTITPAEGYDGVSITVTMGDETIYEGTNGEVSIESATGDIVITATGFQGTWVVSPANQNIAASRVLTASDATYTAEGYSISTSGEISNSKNGDSKNSTLPSSDMTVMVFPLYEGDKTVTLKQMYTGTGAGNMYQTFFSGIGETLPSSAPYTNEWFKGLFADAFTANLIGTTVTNTYDVPEGALYFITWWPTADLDNWGGVTVTHENLADNELDELPIQGRLTQTYELTSTNVFPYSHAGDSELKAAKACLYYKKFTVIDGTAFKVTIGERKMSSSYKWADAWLNEDLELVEAVTGLQNVEDYVLVPPTGAKYLILNSLNPSDKVYRMISSNGNDSEEGEEPGR